SACISPPNRRQASPKSCSATRTPSTVSSTPCSTMASTSRRRRSRRASSLLPTVTPISMPPLPPRATYSTYQPQLTAHDPKESLMGIDQPAFDHPHRTGGPATHPPARPVTRLPLSFVVAGP